MMDRTWEIDLTMSDERTRERAYHQAGRAVLCVTLFGVNVAKLLELAGDLSSVEGFETYSRLPVPLACRPPGHKRGEERQPIQTEGIVDAHGVLAYAGIATIHEYVTRRDGQAGDSVPSNPETAGSEAREQFAKLASSIGFERPADHFYEEYWKESLRLLGSCWPAVETVADALLQHRSLNGRRVDALILGEDID